MIYQGDNEEQVGLEPEATSACNGETVGSQVGDRGAKALNTRYGFFLQQGQLCGHATCMITRGRN